ncbi:iron-siderophore ABC transporter permease, partial [Bacillus spizizenii]|nr:iron-siderophore ABC transporter permease [Bacillus spizizenii]
MYLSPKRRSSSRLMLVFLALIMLICGLGLSLSVGASDS